MLAPEKMNLLKRRLKFRFSFSNASSSIWLFAKTAYSSHLIQDSSQHITLRIQHYIWSSASRITCVYAKCDAQEGHSGMILWIAL